MPANSAKSTTSAENVSSKKGQHLTKLHQIALFIGLPDGEVFLHHLTTHPTRDPTNHPSTPITHHPTPDTQMVRCLVRCLVGCCVNTSPSETRCGKGFSGILVRCWGQPADFFVYGVKESRSIIDFCVSLCISVRQSKNSPAPILRRIILLASFRRTSIDILCWWSR